jgi:hypothetical protein
MNKWIIPILLLILSFGCSDREWHKCQSDSIEDISWLKAEIEDKGYNNPNTFYEVIVYKTSYELGPVFILTICCPACSVTPPEVKNCDGNVVGHLGVDVDSSILDDAKIIWRTHNGVCEG